MITPIHRVVQPLRKSLIGLECTIDSHYSNWLCFFSLIPPESGPSPQYHSLGFLHFLTQNSIPWRLTVNTSERVTVKFTTVMRIPLHK